MLRSAAMVSIPLYNLNNPPEARDRHPNALPIGVVLAVLLHIAPFVLLILLGLWPRPAAEPMTEFVMEVVQLPEKPKPQPPPPAQTVAPNPIPTPPPPIPRFEEAPVIGDKSTPVAPPAPNPNPRSALTPGGSKAPPTPKASTPAPANSDNLAALPVPPSQLTVQQRQQGEAGGGVASQSVQHFILKQVAQRWLLDVHSRTYTNVVLTLHFQLLPNGMLASPFGKNDPWDLEVMFPQRKELPPFLQNAAITFLQALRQAQPFRLPPDEKSYQARLLPLSFRIGDLPQ